MVPKTLYLDLAVAAPIFIPFKIWLHPRLQNKPANMPGPKPLSAVLQNVAAPHRRKRRGEFRNETLKGVE